MDTEKAASNESEIGTKERPLEVSQNYYRRCGHAFLLPMPTKGQFYRRVAFLDFSGRCSDCEEKNKAKRG